MGIKLTAIKKELKNLSDQAKRLQVEIAEKHRQYDAILLALNPMKEAMNALEGLEEKAPGAKKEFRKERKCAICGNTYIATGKAQKNCLSCKGLPA